MEFDKNKEHRIIYLIPAGRRRYMKILFEYLSRDNFIDEIWVFDNCRNPKDRIFINEFLKGRDGKWKFFKIDGADGTNKSVNYIYNYIFQYNERAFFVKIDDDIVYMDKDFTKKFYFSALKNSEDCFLFSPIVINNALISFFLIMEKKIHYPPIGISAQAGCPVLWKSGLFAEYIHKIFLSKVKQGSVADMYLSGLYKLQYQRFSINCIGIFSETVNELTRLGVPFIPLDADDEEYLTSVLSFKLNKKICIINNLIVSHFAFYPQELYLLKYTDCLYEYANLVDIQIEDSDFDDVRIGLKKIFNTIRNCVKDVINIQTGIYLKKQKLGFQKLLRKENLDIEWWL